MNLVSPFRVTPDDLPDLDVKTRNGLVPLLDALNVSVQQLVANSQGTTEQWVSQTLKTDLTVEDSFPLVFKNPLDFRPNGVFLANCLPKDQDHTLEDPFVLNGWTLTDAGLISISWITNLLALNTYTLTFLVK